MQEEKDDEYVYDYYCVDVSDTLSADHVSNAARVSVDAVSFRVLHCFTLVLKTCSMYHVSNSARVSVDAVSFRVLTLFYFGVKDMLNVSRV
jgi:hypothetical protein